MMPTAQIQGERSVWQIEMRNTFLTLSSQCSVFGDNWQYIQSLLANPQSIWVDLIGSKHKIQWI